MALTGFSAWILWLVIHLLYLIGFRNRLVVAINWAWDYVFFERAIRLIPPGVDKAPAWRGALSQGMSPACQFSAIRVGWQKT